MTDKTRIQINGVIYQKSLASLHGGNHCVGVALTNGKISVINTKSEGPTVEFTQAEWLAFIEGVKAGEFEPNRLPST